MITKTGSGNCRIKIKRKIKVDNRRELREMNASPDDRVGKIEVTGLGSRLSGGDLQISRRNNVAEKKRWNESRLS